MEKGIGNSVKAIMIATMAIGGRAAWASHFINRNEPTTFTAPASDAETPGLVSYPPAQAAGTRGAGKEPYLMAQESLNTFQFIDVPWHFGIGPSFVNTNAHHDTATSASVRYQFSPSPWDNTVEFPWHIGAFPLSLSLEAGAIFPHTSPALRHEARTVGSTSFQVTERLAYEGHFGLIDELPHGHQTIVWPEIGVGASMAGLRTVGEVDRLLDFTEIDQTENKLSPWIMAGFHFFPTRFYSGSIGISFFHYASGISVDGQSFNTTLAGWTLLPTLQIQIVWPSRVHVALTPKKLPPWLIPAYTTDDISPWVAAPEVAQDPRWNKPGVPFGNVMFQFKSRYVDKVELVADFTDWLPEPMVKDRGGYWVAVKDVPAGRHLYNFILNGKHEIKDPWNKSFDLDSRAKGSSIVIVP